MDISGCKAISLSLLLAIELVYIHCQFTFFAKILIAYCPIDKLLIAKSTIAEIQIAKSTIAEIQIAKSTNCRNADCPNTDCQNTDCPNTVQPLNQMSNIRRAIVTEKNLF